jgi:hypothetical protein
MVGIPLSAAVSIILREPLEEIVDPSTVAQILWIFICKEGKEQITLKQNPHFYLRIPKLDRESDFLGNGFDRSPLTVIGPGVEQNGTVYVIKNKPCWLYLDTAECRVFGKVWLLQGKILLKGEWVFLSRLSYAPTHKWLRYSRLFILRSRFAF